MSVRKRTWTFGGKEKSAWAATVTDQNGKRRQKSFKTQKARTGRSKQNRRKSSASTHRRARPSLLKRGAICG
jgi:hypothetical protein